MVAGMKNICTLLACHQVDDQQKIYHLDLSAVRKYFYYPTMWCESWTIFAVMSKYVDFVFAFLIADDDLKKITLNVSRPID